MTPWLLLTLALLGSAPMLVPHPAPRPGPAPCGGDRGGSLAAEVEAEIEKEDGAEGVDKGKDAGTGAGKDKLMVEPPAGRSWLDNANPKRATVRAGDDGSAGRGRIVLRGGVASASRPSDAIANRRGADGTASSDAEALTDPEAAWRYLHATWGPRYQRLATGWSALRRLARGANAGGPGGNPAPRKANGRSWVDWSQGGVTRSWAAGTGVLSNPAARRNALSMEASQAPAARAETVGPDAGSPDAGSPDAGREASNAPKAPGMGWVDWTQGGGEKDPLVAASMGFLEDPNAFLYTLKNAEDEAAAAEGIRVQDVRQRVQVGRTARLNRNLQDEDLVWRAFALRMEHGPEGLYAYGVSRGTQEVIRRHQAGASMPLTDRVRLAAIGARESFDLDEQELPDESSSIRHVTTKVVYRPNLLWTHYAGLTAFDGERSGGAGGVFGSRFLSRRGFLVAVDGRVGTPWADNTRAVEDGGRQHGVTLSTTLPLTPWFSLSGESMIDWYYLGEQPDTGQRYAGYEVEGSGRATLTLLRKTARGMGPFHFAEDVGGTEELGTEVALYGSLTRSRFFVQENFAAVPVTEDVLDTRIGATASVVLNRRLGLRGEAYVGQDTERGIAWNKIWGLAMRLEFVPTARVRIWGEIGSDADLATGIGGGITRRFDMGCNINF